MKKKIYNFVKRLSMRFVSKQFDIPKNCSRTIDISSKEVGYFSLSANMIKTIKLDGKIYYYRTCRQHLEFPSYLDKALEDFYIIAQCGIDTDNFKENISIETQFSKEYIDLFRVYIDKLRKDEQFYRMIINTPAELKKMHFSLWHDNYNLSDKTMEAVGLVNYPQQMRPILPLFIVYISGLIINYKKNSFVRYGNYECFNALRTVASSLIAKALNKDCIYTNAELVRLLIDGKEEYGVISPKADGARAKDINVTITPQLQRDLTTLNIIDAICFQKDHNTNNYNVNPKNSDCCVCAFDNDNPITFFISSAIPKSMSGNVSPIIQKGCINRPHIDKNIYESILSLNFSELKKMVGPYLTCAQWFCLKSRIRKIKNALINTNKARTSFVVDSDNWNDDFVKEELSGKYGTTYLTLLSV